MDQDLALLKKLLYKLPLGKIQTISSTALTVRRTDVLVKISKWLEKMPVEHPLKLMCSQWHLHDYMMNYPLECTDEDCYYSFIAINLTDNWLLHIYVEDENCQIRRLGLLYLYIDNGISHEILVQQWSMYVLDDDFSKLAMNIPDPLNTSQATLWKRVSQNVAIYHKCIAFCNYLLGDISYEPISYKVFAQQMAASPLGKLIDYVYASFQNLVEFPTNYVLDAMYTILAIHRFRKDSVVATLPKDIVKLIINEVWECRDDPVWLLE